MQPQLANSTKQKIETSLPQQILNLVNSNPSPLIIRDPENGKNYYISKDNGHLTLQWGVHKPGIMHYERYISHEFKITFDDKGKVLSSTYFTERSVHENEKFYKGDLATQDIASVVKKLAKILSGDKSEEIVYKTNLFANLCG